MAIEFIFKSSVRRKHPAIRINKDGKLEFLAPSAFPISIAKKLLDSNRELIEKLRQKHDENLSRRKEITEGSTVYWYGEKKVINFSHRSHAVLDEKILIPSGDAKTVLAGLEKLYRLEAAKYLPDRTVFLAEKFNIKINKVSIGGAASRWGCCSRDGRIRFSWRLMQCRKELIDYIIVHELAHRIHFDHSENFYREAGKMLNNFDQLRRELLIFSRKEHIL